MSSIRHSLAGLGLGILLALASPAWGQRQGDGPRGPDVPPPPPPPPPPVVPTPQPPIVPAAEVPREVLVVLSPRDPAVARQVANDLARRHNLTVRRLAPLVTLGATLVVFLIPNDRAPRDVAAILRRESQVIEADVNTIYATQNDPLASRQYALVLMGVDRAHTSLRGRNVLVAVVDSGVDVGHEDLLGAVTFRGTLVDGQSQMSPDMHGTAVGGVIAARRDNGMGMIGVSPEASLIALQACIQKETNAAEARCHADYVTRAVDLAVGRRAQVVNLSLGGPDNRILALVIDRAVQAFGVAVVAAAGNNGPKGLPLYPAALPQVIAVGATDAKDAPYEMSNVGPHVVVFAPGVDVVATQPGNRYVFVTGTSYAAAYVSGTLALMVEAMQSQRPAVARLRAALQEGAVRVSGIPAGRVDLCGSLRSLGRSDFCK